MERNLSKEAILRPHDSILSILSPPKHQVACILIKVSTFSEELLKHVISLGNFFSFLSLAKIDFFGTDRFNTNTLTTMGTLGNEKGKNSPKTPNSK